MKWLKTLLLAEQIPYMMTILMAGAFFTFNGLITAEINAPTVCYSVDEIELTKDEEAAFRKLKATDEITKPDRLLRKKHLRYRIENISADKRFETISLIFCFPKSEKENRPQRFFGPEIVAISPAGIDSTLSLTAGEDDNPLFASPGISFQINSFQPGNIYELSFYALYDARIKVDPSPYVYCNTELRFVKKGMNEHILKHRYLFLTLLLLLFLILITGYMKWLEKNKKKPLCPDAFC